MNKWIMSEKEFNIKNLLSIGFSHIDGLSYLGDGALKSKVARLSEKSKGKDTTIGHWEIAGIITKSNINSILIDFISIIFFSTFLTKSPSLIVVS